jgi:hypothetical protein
MYDGKRTKKQLSNQAGFKPAGQPLSTKDAIGLGLDAV